LDANADFPVGEDRIHAYVRAARCPTRLTPGTVGFSTAQFFNRSRTLILYGKRAEMESQFKRNAATAEDVKAATGILRVEARLRGAQIQRLAKKLNVPAEAGQLLTLPVAERIVTSTLADMGLDIPKTSSQATDQKLLDVFGGDAPSMLGVLEWRSRYGEEALKKLWSPSKYYRVRGQLLDSDLWLGQEGVELPALYVADVCNNLTSYSNLGIES
jgi:hypothetical protein